MLIHQIMVEYPWSLHSVRTTQHTTQATTDHYTHSINTKDILSLSV
jgi:hypothetical protein